ncbi:hypothetical protein ALP30_104174 [Pseudomonas syringae pv. primulae]|nr:hypothetical protein ALP30_104174 [Pseudomonas syringae pv. primulae]
MSRKHIQLTSQNRCVMLRVTNLRSTLKIGRRASRTACAERRTIVEIIVPHAPSARPTTCAENSAQFCCLRYGSPRLVRSSC